MGLGLYAVVETAVSVFPRYFGLSKNSIFSYGEGSVALLLASFFVALFCIFLKVRGNGKEILCALMYSASSVIVLTFSDLIAVVVGFEIMALAAMFLIASGGHEDRNVAFTHYACAHFFSGALLLVGACQYEHYGYLEGLPMWSFMAGLLINSAAFPMSSWVISAYPRASHFGMCVLSLFTTKVAMYFLLKMFAGEPAILYAGILTAVFAIVFSFIERNVRRLVSYGIVGQVGLILMSIGCRGIPADIIVAQMAFSVLYQLLFIMVADSAVMSSSHTDLGKMAGSISVYSIEFVGCLVAMLNIASCPGTASFVAKSVALHTDLESSSYVLVKYTQPILGLLLFMCGALKFFWFSVLAHAQATPKVRDSFFSGTPIFILVMVLVLLGGVYGRGILFAEPTFVYTFHGVAPKLALILAVIPCFLIFRNKFVGVHGADAAVERWVRSGFLATLGRLEYGISGVKSMFGIRVRREGSAGIIICGCDTKCMSKMPSGVITSTLLLVMLSICIVLVWFYV